MSTTKRNTIGIIGIALTLVAVLAAAQPAPQAGPQSSAKPTKTFTSAADVRALIAQSEKRA